ncbi:MAG: tetratricopeptide repeat protein [Steroidobacteraceae bacterium]
MNRDISNRLRDAQALRRSGRLEEARRLLEGLLADHGALGDVHLLLAHVDLDLRRWGPALESARSALSLRRSDAAAWYAFARAQKELGNPATAIACYRRALAIEPRNPTLLTSLGTALVGAGQPEQAIRMYREALAAHPDHAGARASLERLLGPAPGGMNRLAQIRGQAQCLHREGRLCEAFDLHREALRVAPQLAGIWLSAGSLAGKLGLQSASLPLFEEAARLDPSSFPAIESARRICVAAGLLDKAAQYSERAYALKPSDDIRIAMALTIAAIQPSMEAIDPSRRAFAAGLDAAAGAGLKVQDLSAAQGMGAFFLAYHGDNDRDLQIKAARLLSDATPGLSMTAAHCRAPTRREGKIRIGFISAFLFNHSIGTTTRGLVTELSRARFEVIVLRIAPSPSDEVTDLIRRAADHTVDLDADYRVARQQIAALELDVLFYQDIGMEPMSYRLAFSRLAPVQCVSFGHPNTTGIPAMDYFVSNDLYEPEDAASHYSEELFLLEDLPTLAYYYRPDPPRSIPDRSAFGLHADDHVYLCPQTLFKLHPEFDALLGGILRRDPQGVLVLIRGQYEEYTDQIRQRWSRTLDDVSNRILFLDRMPFARYMELLSIADVCLDTLHFNGMNSSLEAFSVGTPIVTLPGRMQRGRHTQAMYRKMGITDCIANDAANYIDIAVRLGCDRDYAGTLRERIRARNAVLYEDRRVVEEFERFFQYALDVARSLRSDRACAPPR